MKNIVFLGIIGISSLVLFSASTCSVSLAGISIPPEVNTYYVAKFDDISNSGAATPTLGQDFTELLVNKVRQESRLNYTDTNPDIEFQGNITSFTISPIAPQPGETTAFTRLKITVAVEYIDNKNEERSWKNSFNFFEDFDSSQNLADVQDELIRSIFTQIAEDIFNKAFTNW